MSKSLEKIVASLELCKLIPAGEFEDSALVWRYDRICDFICLLPGHLDETARLRNDGMIYPAPTLAEIFRVLPETIDTPEDEFFVLSLMPVVDDEEDMFWIGYNNTNEEDANPATAALRLCLKLKGIEVNHE